MARFLVDDRQSGGLTSCQGQCAGSFILPPTLEPVYPSKGLWIAVAALAARPAATTISSKRSTTCPATNKPPRRGNAGGTSCTGVDDQRDTMTRARMRGSCQARVAAPKDNAVVHADLADGNRHFLLRAPAPPPSKAIDILKKMRAGQALKGQADRNNDRPLGRSSHDGRDCHHLGARARKGRGVDSALGLCRRPRDRLSCLWRAGAPQGCSFPVRRGTESDQGHSPGAALKIVTLHCRGRGRELPEPGDQYEDRERTAAFDQKASA